MRGETAHTGLLQEEVQVRTNTFLEAAFPFEQVSRLAQRDRNSKDAVYRTHKWWARRPPAVIRALLLAGTLPAATEPEQFWTLFASDEPLLDGVHVGDPFMGGATTLVEAARLGAHVTGIDVDPLAVQIALQELEGVNADTITREADALLDHLRGRLGDLWGVQDRSGRAPLHYFWLRSASCPNCRESSLLYRNLVLARDLAIRGAVVRDAKVVAFCPDCRRLHNLGLHRKELRCCGRRRQLTAGTFRAARFVCPSCSARATHQELQTALLPRVLIAVEETTPEGRRVLRRPHPADLGLDDRAATAIAGSSLKPPNASLVGVDSGRPVGYGFRSMADLFTPRQIATFLEAFEWLSNRDLAAADRRGMLLGISNALSTNNLLCGYASNYGRLSPLFSVRSYSMPVLGVELNPLHLTGGRGTLRNTLLRVVRSQVEEVHRHTVHPKTRRVRPQSFTARRDTAYHIACQSADRPFPRTLGKLDLAVSDPPYYDYISYSDLSLFFRSWLSQLGEQDDLAGAPLYPVGKNPAREFSARLGRAFTHIRAALKEAAPLVFTFHSTNPEAWAALEGALLKSRLAVTGLFPIWTDARSGGHRNEGNCEWDIVFICRPAGPAVQHVDPNFAQWLRRLRSFKIATSDKRSMKMAIDVATNVNNQPTNGEET